MDFKLRVTVEKIDIKTNKVIDKCKIETIEIHKLTSIMEFGLNHKSQIMLAKKIQQKVLNEQYKLVADEPVTCSKCHAVMRRHGYKESNFHGVLSDHKIKMQRHYCANCQETQVPSIKSFFGTSIHPELYKLQCELGAAFSFYKSEVNWPRSAKKKEKSIIISK